MIERISCLQPNKLESMLGSMMPEMAAQWFFSALREPLLPTRSASIRRLNSCGCRRGEDLRSTAELSDEGLLTGSPLGALCASPDGCPCTRSDPEARECIGPHSTDEKGRSGGRKRRHRSSNRLVAALPAAEVSEVDRDAHGGQPGPRGVTTEASSFGTLDTILAIVVV